MTSAAVVYSPPLQQHVVFRHMQAGELIIMHDEVFNRKIFVNNFHEFKKTSKAFF